jgi:hypothetical protein
VERDDEGQPVVSYRQNTIDANGERVQILDLHSENPIISYKGRVFSGQWCANTATELLMTRHEENNYLPVLRHLANGVDLLAASSARINVKEQKLKPKVTDQDRQRASTQLPQTVIPPVDLKASQERIDQRNFLANLITLKKRKGENDDVTIIARSMQGPRAKMKVKSTRTHRRGRWAHSDKLQAVRGLEERPTQRRGGRKRGSRGRGKWALFPLEEPTRDSASVASSVVDEVESGVSTPTPFRWDDLEEGQDDSPARMESLMEVDMEDELDEDEVGYDENNDMGEDEEDDNNDGEEDEEDDQGEMDEDDEDNQGEMYGDGLAEMDDDED